MTRKQIIERMLANVEFAARRYCEDQAAGGGPATAPDNYPDVIYVRGYRDGQRDHVRPELEAEYKKAQGQLRDEADPDYQQYLSLKAKFEKKV